MRKSDKKLENQLRVALTEVCETALKNFEGFEWLTHLVNYSHFPKSLTIVCVFDTNDNLTRFKGCASFHELSFFIEKKLVEIDININNILNHISYDTEEACTQDNNGNWAERLK